MPAPTKSRDSQHDPFQTSDGRVPKKVQLMTSLNGGKVIEKNSGVPKRKHKKYFFLVKTRDETKRDMLKRVKNI